MSHCYTPMAARCGDSFVPEVRNRQRRYVLPKGRGLTHLKSRAMKVETKKRALEEAREYIDKKL